MGLIVHAVAGLIFGIGLVISEMANPAKVLNFLDVTGTWDPSLAFVMAGAIAVAAAGYWLVFRRSRPLISDSFHVPPRWPIESRIIVGAALFGIGWGLAGFCPGPAVTSLALGAPGTLAFIPAMLAGVAIAAVVRSRS